MQGEAINPRAALTQSVDVKKHCKNESERSQILAHWHEFNVDITLQAMRHALVAAVARCLVKAMSWQGPHE